MGVWKYCGFVGLKIDYTPRCLDYICSVYSPLSINKSLALTALAPLGILIVKTLDKCTLTITYYLHYNLSTNRSLET